MIDIWQHMTPVLWECKDYADGWIRFPLEEEAAAYQQDTGCMVRVYYRPAAPTTPVAGAA